MKNILGLSTNLKLFYENRIKRYQFYAFPSGSSFECTYDSDGYILTYKNSDGDWSEYTRDSEGKELTYKDSDGIKRGFNIPEFTMEELVAKLGNFKIKK